MHVRGMAVDFRNDSPWTREVVRHQDTRVYGEVPIRSYRHVQGEKRATGDDEAKKRCEVYPDIEAGALAMSPGKR